jgi:hypothetical protein
MSLRKSRRPESGSITNKCFTGMKARISPIFPQLTSEGSRYANGKNHRRADYLAGLGGGDCGLVEVGGGGGGLGFVESPMYLSRFAMFTFSALGED